MWRRLLSTDDRILTAAQRFALGAIMFPHAAQKVFGWFGGFGLHGTLGFFEGQLGLPAALAGTAIAIEMLGALGLLAGLFTRFSALGIIAIMVGAIATVHIHNGFFMNWTGQQAGEGFEFHLLAIVLAIGVLIRGGGAWSLDALLARTREAPAPAPLTMRRAA